MGVLSNIKDFTKWISGNNNNLIKTDWKPTNIYVGALIWYKKDKSYIEYFYKNNTQFKKSLRFEFMNYFNKDCFTNSRRLNNIPQNNNEALALSSIEFAKEAPTYVYAPRKNETSKLANTILKIMKDLDINCYNHNLRYYEEDDEDIIQLIDSIKQEIGEDSELLDYIAHGFIIHHADLPDKVKGYIENVLRKRKLNLVIATSTLVQGVNFPFKTIIFKGLYTNSNLIDYSTFFNICGRAGRATEENNGRVLIFLGNINIKNRKEKKKIQDKLRRFDEFFSSDQYHLKSIFYPLLEKIKKHFSQKCSPEEFIYKLINEFDLSEIFNNGETMNVDSIDTQLLAFIEEEDDANELLNNFIKVTLYHVQDQKRNNQLYLKGFIKSRLSYLKKEFSDSTASHEHTIWDYH